MKCATVLTLPNFSAQFIVECDASGLGIGVVLLQRRSITFLSHTLKGKNMFLSMYEKEILALVVAIQK